MDKLGHDILAAVLAFVMALVPAALGAAVSLAYESGLTWSRRLLQMMVGITVSYFATGAAAALFTLSPFVLQAISFVFGMIAFKATPKVIAGLTDRVGEAPGAIFDRILPRKDRP